MPKPLRGTIHFGGRKIARIIVGEEEKAKALVKRSKYYTEAHKKINRSRDLLEEVLNNDQFGNERLKGKIEAFLENTGKFPRLDPDEIVDDEDVVEKKAESEENSINQEEEEEKESSFSLFNSIENN